eukprot:COSAG06_NODE_282_length_18378_cov_85.787461_13_plen_57_part_00
MVGRVIAQAVLLADMKIAEDMTAAAKKELVRQTARCPLHPTSLSLQSWFVTRGAER